MHTFAENQRRTALYYFQRAAPNNLSAKLLAVFTWPIEQLISFV